MEDNYLPEQHPTETVHRYPKIIIFSLAIILIIAFGFWLYTTYGITTDKTATTTEETTPTATDLSVTDESTQADQDIATTLTTIDENLTAIDNDIASTDDQAPNL